MMIHFFLDVYMVKQIKLVSVETETFIDKYLFDTQSRHSQQNLHGNNQVHELLQ